MLQVLVNSTLTANMTFTKTSQKFGQWSDAKANTVYGLGFSSEDELLKVSNITVAFKQVFLWFRFNASAKGHRDIVFSRHSFTHTFILLSVVQVLVNASSKIAVGV